MQKDAYTELCEIQNKHWWFLSRKEIIDSIISSNLKSPKGNEILEIGCGMGGNFDFLSKYGKITAIEPNEDAVKYCSSNYKGIDVYKSEFPYNIPEEINGRKFDLIIMLDVLEHIREDEKAIKVIKKFMHENSLLVLTVPSYNYLFGPHDIRMGHFRRYSKSDLERKFLNKGYNILFSSYYCFFTFPLFFVIRLIEKFLYNSGKYRMKVPSKIVNNVLASIFSFEKNFLLKNLKFPFGSSVVLLAGLGK